MHVLVLLMFCCFPLVVHCRASAYEGDALLSRYGYVQTFVHGVEIHRERSEREREREREKREES